ncbi:MAG: Thermostable beta-glucosidase B [Promethearchaeota archaeon]|nr:MAG: Thermostable beta-glucosidase B [Candidatus Lokiarchaeota archaeon]
MKNVRESILELNWESFENLSPEKRGDLAKKILAAMTLEEKAEKMAGDDSFIHVIGMLIHYNKSPISAGNIEELGIPGIEFTDGPRGVVLNHSTCFPVSMARGATWDKELEIRIGNAIGIEAKSQGANFFGGVCINLLRHPAWGRAQETYGEDPYHLGEMGSALVQGVQQHIMACAKHYACNSIENTRFKLNVQIDERTLREVYLPHFKKCVDTNVASIMSAYNRVNGSYCGHNEHLLRDILKKDWNFQGFVITDFVFGIRDGKKAINAGVDIEMPYQWKMKPKKIVKWVGNGEISEDLIDDAVLRILRQEIKFAKKQDPEVYNSSTIVSEEHKMLALEAAQKSIVLLKNEHHFLPLKSSSLKKIVVIGQLATMKNLGDKGSSRVYPPYVVTPLEGIQKAVGEDIEVVYDNGKNLQKVKQVCMDADAVVIVVGFTYKEEGENMTFGGGDRDSLRLTEYDEHLILSLSEVFNNCIVVMEGGSAIITEKWRQNIPAILMVWYPGMEGGTALADLIFGKVNPSGKLPIVFPKNLEQLPHFDSKTKEIEYGYYHGYRLMDKEGYEPAFPFGYGLSYTTYTYKNLRLSKHKISPEESLEIKIDITNSGTIKGEEIAQLYIGYNNSSVDRPLRDLKGFARISLNSQETKTISLHLNPKDLSYYDSKTQKWVLEEITYSVYVGPSSQETDFLEATFEISTA